MNKTAVKTPELQLIVRKIEAVLLGDRLRHQSISFRLQPGVATRE